MYPTKRDVPSALLTSLLGKGNYLLPLNQLPLMKCEECLYRRLDMRDGGHCYMFRDKPSGTHCGQFKDEGISLPNLTLPVKATSLCFNAV